MDRRRRTWLAAGIIAALSVTAASAPVTASAAARGCSYTTSTQPFAPWQDAAYYTEVSGGTFEPLRDGWSKTGTAAVGAGNETFYAHGAADKRSLGLPDGGTASSPATCVTLSTPSIRLFVRNDGASTSSLNVDVGVIGSKTTTWNRVATLVAQGPGWAASPIILLNLPSSAFGSSGAAKVVFRFGAQGSGGAWRIDDVYLDPFKRK
jgi:hypothetical protein